MTIEKTIELAREQAKDLIESIEFCVQKEISGCDECIHCDIPCMEQAKEIEQIAEWLEELRIYRQHEIICRNGYNAGYNKALDDFVKFANTMPTFETEDGEIRPMWLEEMAEKLKAGVKNEQT